MVRLDDQEPKICPVENCPTTATVAAVRESLSSKLNMALVRPGMWHEGAAEEFLTELAFLDGDSGWRQRSRRALSARGAFESTGIGEPLRRALGHVNLDWNSTAISMMFADFAHELGYLRPERFLSLDEYQHLREGIRDWAREDRTADDMVAEYGRPSLGKAYSRDSTVGYCCTDRTEPVILLDFVAAEYSDVSSLQAVRWRGPVQGFTAEQREGYGAGTDPYVPERFPSEFTLTPLGQELKVQALRVNKLRRAARRARWRLVTNARKLVRTRASRRLLGDLPTYL